MNLTGIRSIMRKLAKIGVTVASVWWAALSYAELPEQCPPPQGVALQVLGSGGPIGDIDRETGARQFVLSQLQDCLFKTTQLSNFGCNHSGP